jgi:hypothetical protein
LSYLTHSYTYEPTHIHSHSKNFREFLEQEYNIMISKFNIIATIKFKSNNILKLQIIVLNFENDQDKINIYIFFK